MIDYCLLIDGGDYLDILDKLEVLEDVYDDLYDDYEEFV